LGQFCRERGISRLELFGSALREDFRDDSDVDLLASLCADAHPTLFDWADMERRHFCPQVGATAGGGQKCPMPLGFEPPHPGGMADNGPYG